MVSKLWLNVHLFLYKRNIPIQYVITYAKNLDVQNIKTNIENS